MTRRAARARAYAGELIRTLALTLDRVCALDRALARDLDCVRVLDLTSACARALALDIASARNVVRALDRNLDRDDDRARADDLDTVLYAANVRALKLVDVLDRPSACASGFARAFVNAFVGSYDLASARNSALAFDHALDLASANANASVRARIRVSAFPSVSAFVSAFVSALDLDRALALANALVLDFDRDLALVDALDRARVRDRARRSAASGAGAVVVGGARAMPGRTTRGLIALAVWLLPVGQRPRYHAEFGVELVELPRRQRWGYALRVLASALELRRALVVAVRTWDDALTQAER